MSAIHLETSGLLLRPFSLAYAEELHRMWIEPSMRKFLWDDKIIPMETVTEIIEARGKTFFQNGLGYWMISLKETSQPVGFCGLRHFHFEDEPANADEVEILYGLTAAYCGKGLATEASVEVLRYGFVELGLMCIYAGADPPNRDSFRVMERLGMKFLRQTVIGGLDAIYYVLNRDEFLDK
ncbi:MAG: GNAT family N-acetyltransferase [Acidobacteriota bacterium]